MADVDSLHDLSSDQDADPEAMDGDVENDDTADDGPEDGEKKKSRKKKMRRPQKGITKSSGDSDSQAMSEDQESEDSRRRHHHLHHPDGAQLGKKKEEVQQNNLSRSGADADTEGQSQADQKDDKKGKAEKKGFLTEVQQNNLSGSGADADTEGQSQADQKDDKKPKAEKTDKAQAKREEAAAQMMASEAFTKAQLRQLERLTLAAGTPKNMEDAAKKRYQFWETQPVPKLNEKITGNGHIEPDKPVEEIRADPYSLPGGFTWDTLDIGDPLILKELYTLLNENYVEDDDNMFRFDYSPEFLQWALQPPGWLKEWHCGVRVVKSKKLVGFISAVPAHIKIYDKSKQMVEINFLCVHKKLRSKRVAPVLIREITRRVHLKGLFQAVYTAGVVLPKPISCCRYWHRSLNPKKLIEVKFSHLSRNMTMQRTLKLYKLPENPKTPGFRAFTPADVQDCFTLLGEVKSPEFGVFTPADVQDCFTLLGEYLNTLDLSPVFTVEEFRHWFIPRKGIIDSYVVEKNGKITDFVSFYTLPSTAMHHPVHKTLKAAYSFYNKNGKITDFVSFYTLPSTVMHHPVHKTLKAAYSFYNVSTATPWVDLMQDALIEAKNMGFDVFNALDLMRNKDFLEKLKFGIGDGNLQYYLYNWRCAAMEPHQVGLVLQ